MSQGKQFKIYKASAGSGKTFTIVKEYLTLCLDQNPDAYREILAVTFTNKAASEMKAKILRFLLGFIEGSKKGDILQMKGYLMSTLNIDETELVRRANILYTNMLHNYSDMAVCTIDSFVQRLSRSFAKELELPGQYSVMLDSDDLIDEIIRRLSDKIGKDKFITTIVSNYVKYNLSEENDGNTKKLIGDFIEKLLAEDAYRKGNGKNFNVLDENKFIQIKNYLESEIAKIEKNLPTIVNDIESEEKILGITDEDYNGQTRGLPSVKKKMRDGEGKVTTPSIDVILNGDKRWNNAKSKISGDTIVSVYIKAIEKYKSLYTKKLVFELINKDLYLYTLRNNIFEMIRDFIDETSQVHITEFNKRISDILGDCSVPFIYERIGEKYKHYFIDEFQDTSVLQWQNFLSLMDNSLSNGNMNMVVGDAKQSIYRFRNGEVEQIINLPKIYRRPKGSFGDSCEQQFVASAQKMTLGTNYRSSKNVIKFNNTFFRYAERFLNIPGVYNDAEQAYDPKKQGGFVSVEVFDGALKSAEYKEKVKASMLAKIRELKSHGVDYKDITILVRSNNDGTDIANYLVSHGIDVLSAESVLLQTSDKVQLVVNTLRSMVDDKNPVTKLAIDHFSKDVDTTCHVNKNDTSYNLYDTCIQICKSYNFNVLEDVFLQYFMNKVNEWQSRHSAGIGDFLEYWDKKKEKLAVEMTGDLDCVTIMTVHKAKGLEFKVVLYPYAPPQLLSTQSTKTEIWVQCADNQYTKDIPHLDAFLLKLMKKIMVGTEFESYYEKERNKTALDNLNIMYVAMTRAKNMLYIYTIDKKPKESDNNKKSDNSSNLFTDFFADNNVPDGSDIFVKNDEFIIVKGEETTVYNYGDFDSTLLTVKEEDTKDDEVKILELKDGDKAPTTINWFEKLKVDADPTMLWAEKGTFRPDTWGSLVHQILSRIKTIDDAEKALRPYVNDGTIDAEQAAKLLDTFRKVTEIPELKPAFSADAIVKNEMDIHTSDGRIIRPDRYAETPQGTILIDYKTGKEHEEYFNQLQDYMSALIQMNGNKKLKAYLVYLDDEISLVEVKMDRLF